MERKQKSEGAFGRATYATQKTWMPSPEGLKSLMPLGPDRGKLCLSKRRTPSRCAWTPSFLDMACPGVLYVNAGLLAKHSRVRPPSDGANPAHVLIGRGEGEGDREGSEIPATHPSTTDAAMTRDQRSSLMKLRLTLWEG